MSVFKVEKNKNFTVMSNYHLQDKNLSLKAKGLLSYMLSLPEDWDYSLKGLCASNKESVKAIRSTLKELEEYKYLIRSRKQLENGRFDYEYLIFETPYSHKGNADNGHSLKDTQINTNIINTKEEMDKEDKVNHDWPNEQSHNYLTQELIKKGFITNDDSQVFYYDKLFEDLLSKGYSYRDLIMYVHYIIPKVKFNDFKDEYGYEIENKFGYFKNALISNINKLENMPDNLYDF